MSNLQRPEPPTLYHVTPTCNLESIGKQGLLARHSRGKRMAVWLVDRSRVEWAVLHVCKRHERIQEEVSVIEVVAPPRRLCKSGRPGLWYTPDDVPYACLSDAWSVNDWLDECAPGDDDWPEAPEGVQIGG